MDEEHSQEDSNVLLGRFRASQFTEHVEDMTGRRILPGDVMMQFGTTPPSVELARALDVVPGSPHRNGGRLNLVTEQMLAVQERDNNGPRRIQFNGVTQGAFGVHAGSSRLIDSTRWLVVDGLGEDVLFHARWLLSKPDLFHGIGRQLSPANPGGVKQPQHLTTFDNVWYNVLVRADF